MQVTGGFCNYGINLAWCGSAELSNLAWKSQYLMVWREFCIFDSTEVAFLSRGGGRLPVHQ